MLMKEQEEIKCNSNGCNCTKEERAKNNGNCKHSVVVHLPQQLVEEEWGKELFGLLYDEYGDVGQNGNIKSFISSLLSKEKEKAYKERDVKWKADLEQIVKEVGENIPKFEDKSKHDTLEAIRKIVKKLKRPDKQAGELTKVYNIALEDLLAELLKLKV